MSDKVQLARKRDSGFEIKNGEILKSNTSCYHVLDFVGEGRFGKVVKCVKMSTAEHVAVKIFKNTDKEKAIKQEIRMLQIITALDPEKVHLVQFFEMFMYRGRTCLAFEMLDMDLYHFLKERRTNPLTVAEIRPIAHQLVLALEALKDIGVIHADMKPDNIMLVNHETHPFKVKLIDFGLSIPNFIVKRGMKIQRPGYRAPEVTLGLPISSAVDMWSLGCILSFLYLSTHLFSVYCQYQEAEMEYIMTTGMYPGQSWKTVSSLDELLTLYPETKDPYEKGDRREFVKLLKCLLQIDPEQRISPAEAFTLPFLAMLHLKDGMDRSFCVNSSFERMTDCQIDEEDDSTSYNNDAIASLSDGVATDGAVAITIDGGLAEEDEPANPDPARETFDPEGSGEGGAPFKPKRSKPLMIIKFFRRILRSVFKIF